MSLRPDQLRAWRPHDLVEVAAEWNSVADELEQYFGQYADSVIRTGEGGYWEGPAADTAHQTAQDDRKHIADMTDTVRGMAKLLTDNWYTIEAPLRRAVSALDTLMAVGFPPAVSFPVSSGFQFTDDTIIGNRRWADLSPAEQAEIKQADFDLGDGAKCAVAADASLRDQLNAQAAGLPALFTDESALGKDQAHTDGDALVDGTMSPDEVARLVDAGTLTPDQLAGLQSGGAVTIPASQMQYLSEMARSLDGKSPQEITQIMNTLPPDGRQALSNGLQILSTERVNAGPAGHGEFNRLPESIRKSLTRKDLVEKGFDGPGVKMPAIELNGVADNQAIAQLVSAGDDRYQQGSTLDGKLLDVGRQYLDAQVQHEQNPDNKFEYFTVDGKGAHTDDAITESIFAAAGNDKSSVEGLVTDDKRGKDFVLDVMSHQWSDDGKAASTLFTFTEDDATVTDPNNPADVAAATRSGHIMSSVAEYISSDAEWKALSDMAGDNSESVGQRNPALLRSVSESMTPYISELARDPSPDRPGFDIDWIDKQKFSQSANLAALLNTDSESGKIFNTAVMENVQAKELVYARDFPGSEAGGHLLTAGRLQGILDRGMMNALDDQYGDDFQKQQEAYNRKNAALEGATGVIKLASGLAPGPTGTLTSFPLDAFQSAIKDSILGPAPQPGQAAELKGPDEFRQIHAILQARENLHGIPPSLAGSNEYRDLFGENGRLESYDEITRSSSRNDHDLKALLEALGGSDADEMMTGYGQVVLKDG